MAPLVVAILDPIQEALRSFANASLTLHQSQDTEASLMASLLTPKCETLSLALLASPIVVSAHLCHDAHAAGFVALQYNDTSERAALLRVGGPHPQTGSFFRAAGSTRTWLARFRLCEGGEYTAQIRLLSFEPWRSAPQQLPSCNIHARSEALIVEGHAWAVPDQRELRTRACLRELWYWSPMRPELRDPSAPLPVVECAGDPAFTMPKTLAGSTASERCALAVKSVERNVRGVPPLASAAEARASLSNITLTGFEFRGRGFHGPRMYFDPAHRWKDALEPTFAQLRYAPAAAQEEPVKRCHRAAPKETGSGSGWKKRPQAKASQGTGAALADLPAAVGGRGCLCILGDSASRAVANRLVQAHDVQCNSYIYRGSHWYPCPSEHVAWTEVRFGLEYFFDLSELNASSLRAFMNGMNGEPARCSACAAVLLNFGRWPLAAHGATAHGAHHTPPVPWSLYTYAKQVDRTLRWLSDFGRRNDVPVGWLSTQPYPLHRSDRQVACDDGVNGRTGQMVYQPPHRVAPLNDVARALAEAHCVDYVDSWRIALDLLELSFDGAHHDDPVGGAVAELVAAWAVRSLTA